MTCKVFLSICLLFVVIGCAESQQEGLFVVMGRAKSSLEGLKDSGIFGEHPLIRMENFRGTNGSISGSFSGSFFLSRGSVTGSLNSEFELQFYWCPKPKEVVITTLPYSKFRFIIDETKNIPTVEFVFDGSWLAAENENVEKNFPNLNDIISLHLKLARVRISSATMEKEVYIPKIR